MGEKLLKQCLFGAEKRGETAYFLTISAFRSVACTRCCYSLWIQCLGHRNGDITTHYSAPELEELLEAANSVCSAESGKSPALVVLKQKAATA